MATPSSSATSPSPTMTYLPGLAVVAQPSQPSSIDSVDRDHRKKAVQKFLARAELSSVTRALRARLAYASFKATNNVPHVSMRDLEAQSLGHNPAMAFSRINAAKRRAPGSNNYYNNPATQSPGVMGAAPSPLRRSSLGVMPPPAAASTSRSHYPPFVNGGAGPSNYAGHETGRPAQSLFTSILAPPPAKQARTIHNANDPPIPAPVRPNPSSRVGNAKVMKSIAEGTRAHAKSRVSKKGSSPDKRKGKRPVDKKRSRDVDGDGDVEMKAAATLTSLLMNHRPSIAGSASSPRSSIDETESGPSRLQRPLVPGPSVSSVASSSTLAADPTYRVATPPGSKTPVQSTTPRPAPTDNEAADLMLFLATSPSPARRSKEDKDQLAFRTLGGGGAGALRGTGRVLFPSLSQEHEEGSNAASGSSRGPTSGLARGTEASFASSVSSIGSEMSARRIVDNRSPSVPVPSPGAQLLPPPAFPSAGPVGNVPNSATAPSQAASPGYRKIQDPNPRPSSGQSGGPGPEANFNFNDFLHASPLPSRPTVPHAPKVNNLRADVGRKLFEEEQMRLGMHGQKSADQRPLGAGIDLLKS